MEPLALTVADAVRLIGVGKTTIYRLIAQGRLSSIKIGRRKLVLMASVHELMQREQVR